MGKRKEIPQCVICLSVLRDDLAVAKCGHVFHFEWYTIVYPASRT